MPCDDNGDLEIPCYVLDDGRSVITQSGMLSAMKMSQGTATKGGGDRIANFANTKSISPFISATLGDVIMNPIRFKYAGQLACTLPPPSTSPAASAS